nr:DUF3880 domain-containing protein [bacterium]
MKVFAFIKQSSAAKFIITDIVEAFNRTGAEILFIDFDLFVKQNKNIRLKEKYDKIAEMIVRIKEFNPDMIICYGLEIFTCIFEDMDSNLKISLFDYFKIKPVCCFLFDFGEPFNDKSEEIVCLEKFQSHNVIYFVWDKEAIRIMNKCGIVNVFYFPMAVNEKYFFEDHSIQRNKSICFIGGPTKERIQTLESIVQYSPEIFGYGKEEWIKSVPLKEYYKYPVYTREELRTIYSQYLFSINITRPHGFSSLNMRVYESIICG